MEINLLHCQIALILLGSPLHIKSSILSRPQTISNIFDPARATFISYTLPINYFLFLWSCSDHLYTTDHNIIHILYKKFFISQVLLGPLRKSNHTFHAVRSRSAFSRAFSHLFPCLRGHLDQSLTFGAVILLSHPLSYLTMQDSSYRSMLTITRALLHAL